MLNTHGVKPSSYVTGHVPAMSFAEFVAHVNARSTFITDLATQQPEPKAKAKRKRRKRTVQELLKLLTEEQRQELASRL